MEGFDPKICAVLKKKGYVLEKEIGHGSFGRVFKGLKYTNIDDSCRRNNSITSNHSSRRSLSKSSKSMRSNSFIQVAVKVMSLDKISYNVKRYYLPREMEALIKIKHQYAIRLYDIIRADNKLFIFMEFAHNGDLANYVIKNGKLSEIKASKWFGQVTCALVFIHEVHHIAHRDIKMDNVLLDQKMNAKLTDFGFAKISWDRIHHRVILSDTDCGTPVYFPPQIHRKDLYNPYLADVWSMGVMLYCMVLNKFPFHGESVGEVLRQQCDYPQYIEGKLSSAPVSQNCKFLILSMLNPDEDKRFTMHQVQNSDWLQQSGK